MYLRTYNSYILNCRSSCLFFGSFQIITSIITSSTNSLHGSVAKLWKRKLFFGVFCANSFTALTTMMLTIKQIKIPSTDLTTKRHFRFIPDWTSATFNKAHPSNEFFRIVPFQKPILFFPLKIHQLKYCFILLSILN